MKRGYWIIAFFIFCIIEIVFIDAFFNKKPKSEMATVIDIKSDSIEVRLDSGGKVFANDKCDGLIGFGDRVRVELINGQYIIKEIEKSDEESRQVEEKQY